jgi:hypothetical protein
MLRYEGREGGEKGGGEKEGLKKGGRRRQNV